MNTAIVVAAYNEHKHISSLVKDVRRHGYEWIIVVDDCSKDNTGELAQKAGATVLRHIVNLGKGAAMRTGAEYAVSHGADLIVFIDGDGQHEPRDIAKFIKELQAGNDIVFSYRHRTKTMPAVQRFGNWFISAIINRLYKMQLRDSQCGFRAMTVKAYKKIRWTSRDYSVESEMIALAGKHRLKYTEFEIATIYHDRYKGTTFLHGFPIVWNLFWWRLFR